MPTDPATVPPLTDADIVRILREVGYVISSGRDADTVKNNPDGAASARAAYALAASRVDTAEVERRAAREALTRCEKMVRAIAIVQPTATAKVADSVLMLIGSEYPAPAPRECVKVDGEVWTRDGEPAFPWRTERRNYRTDAEMSIALAKALAAEVGQ